MEEDEIILEDWKMTKDRIKHFDDVVMRTRLQGIPIATALQAAAVLTADTFEKIAITIPYLNFNIPLFSLIVLAGLVYLVPVIFLDWVHFILLMKAVKHALKIEAYPQFKNKLEITGALTSDSLTLLHKGGAIFAYILIMTVGLILVFSGPDIIKNIS